MGITLPHLLIIAVLVILLFGTKKLRSLGSDLGSSIKGFKKAMSDEDDKEKTMLMMMLTSMPNWLNRSRLKRRKKTSRTTRCNPCST